MFGKTSLAFTFCLGMKYLDNRSTDLRQIRTENVFGPSLEFDGQSQRSKVKVKVTRDKRRTFSALLAACVRFLFYLFVYLLSSCFLLWPWTLTFDLHVRTWPRSDQDEPICRNLGQRSLNLKVIVMLLVLNSFMNKRSMTKWSDLRSALLKGHASRPYNKIGRHFPLMSWSTYSSLVKAKFHYAIWFEAGRRPAASWNSVYHLAC